MKSPNCPMVLVRAKDFAGSLIKCNLIRARFSGSLMSGVAPKNSTPVTGKRAHTHTHKDHTCLFSISKFWQVRRQLTNRIYSACQQNIQ